ncbi:transmembrane protein 171-like [Spea bombifrons]|uniref:transmembrane protein 171-like n=1 Tax=Spea bombifrons TaxID=233779 RepID=UPI0023497726|nr:transmembrane protein 171-like [Spea bombifrons]
MERTCFGTPGPRTSSRITFALCVFGWALLCGGSLLSVYGFATCQSDSCIAYKVTGPVLAGLGLACLIMAEFTAQRERRRELEGDPTDPDSSFLCGKSRQLAQFLILGMLLLVCGVIVCIPGLVVPACKPASNTDKPPKLCAARLVQVIAVALGLCYWLAVCVIRSRGCSASRESPSYDSIDLERGDNDSGGENEHDVPWLRGTTVQNINEYYPSEPPPTCEDINPTEPDPEESSSSSSSSSYHSVSQSSESSDYELAPGP